MSLRIALLSLVLAASATACGQSLTDRAEAGELYFAEDGDEDMQLAYRQAREGLDGFLDAHRQPPPGHTDFSVKVGITESGNTEYFWVSPFQERGDGFVGILNNEPRMVTSVRLGEDVGFSRQQIVDWLYRRDGRMIGNFTACAMLKKESVKDRLEFEQRFGLECRNP